MSRWRSSAGFSLVELMVAMGLLLAVVAAVFALLGPASEMFRAQPEAQDLQQRLRVVIDALQQDLLMAGAGMSMGASMGPLHRYLAPIRPYRIGDSAPDPPAGVFHRDDAISLVYVPATSAQASVQQAVPAGGALIVQVAPNCGPEGRDRLCGFQPGARVLLFDASGRSEFGSVAGVDGLFVHVEGSGLRGYIDPGEGAVLTEVETHVYALGRDAASGHPRLMRYDGRRTDLPVTDHVVRLRFEYFGEGAPPMVLPGADLLEPRGPWTTYGPRPPPVDSDRAGDSWGSGENCLFAVVEEAQVPRLAVLAGAGSIVRLDPAMLADGPWCPDGNDPDRYDADLLRIRRVHVVVRVEAADASLRGPAGPLFLRAGSATSPRTLVPDQEIEFDIAPRNMGLR